MFLICSYFLPFLCSDNVFTVGVVAVQPTLLYKHLRLLRVETLKWTKIKQLLSTSQDQIVPRFKQLTSQQSIFLVAEN